MYCFWWTWLHIFLRFVQSTPNINDINARVIQNAKIDEVCLQCIQQLVKYYRPDEREILVTNINLNIFLNKTIKTIDLGRSEDHFLIKEILTYVLDIRNHADNEKFHHMLKKNSLKVRAKFIFITEFLNAKVTKEFLKVLSDYYICKVLIIDRNFDVYTYHPYKHENLNKPNNEPIKVTLCSEVRRNLNIFTAAVYPKLWRNSTVKVYFRPMSPYANENFTGIEQRLLLAIGKRLGITTIPVLGDNKFQGIEVNGTYQNKGLNLLYKRFVQIVAGGYEADHELWKNFDSSPVLFVGGINFFAPKSIEASIWYRLLNIFTAEANFAILGTFIIWIIFIRISYGEKSSNLIFMSFMIYWQAPVPNLMKYKFRIPLAFWILGLYILSITIMTLLQKIFSTDSYEPQIHSMEDVLDSKLPVLVPPEILDSFKQSDQKRDQILSARMVPCKSDTNKCLARVCIDKSAVMIAPEIFVKEALNLCFNSERGELMYHMGAEVDISYLQIYYVHGFPLREALNQVILRAILHAGIAMKEHQEGLERLKKVLARKKAKLKSNSLNITHLIIAYLIWLGGMVTSIIVFLIEVFLRK